MGFMGGTGRKCPNCNKKGGTYALPLHNMFGYVLRADFAGQAHASYLVQ